MPGGPFACRGSGPQATGDRSPRLALVPRSLLALTLALGVLLVSGCSASAPTAAEPSASIEAPAATPTPTPTPTPADALVISLDGVRHDSGSEQTLYALDDGAALVSFFDELTGTAATGTEVEGPYGGLWAVRYDWPGLRVFVPEEGPASMSITAASVGGLPVTFDGGLSIGSTREAAVAAGAWDVWDSDGDGVADQLGLGGEEVPGTESLSRPGQVGILYTLLLIDDDAVAEVQLPGNDFSDI